MREVIYFHFKEFEDLRGSEFVRSEDRQDLVKQESIERQTNSKHNATLKTKDRIAIKTKRKPG